MNDIKALAFDVFGTVVDWRSSIAKEVQMALARASIEVSDPFEFADRWRALYQPSMEACRSGARPFTRLDVIHREMLDQVLRDYGVSSLPESEIQLLALAWRRLAPWPDSVDALTRLKKRYTIVTLSNGNIALMTELAKRASLPWDAILGAEISKTFKPQPQTYLTTADVLGFRPDEVALVAAHNDDLHAARTCGLRTMFVLRKSEHGPNQKIDLYPEEEWDVCAENLANLADKLGC
ncbi:haloacid dehalogenase type II [Paraburkholderia phenoliruptrix]|uniref:haloacid dehalogenase type II n=1 Tax=Paraburkholderia phenoliruptrix TaxID=252970 RepID=UPI002869C450|nr:haloacid dehalogenase type II [Paraburkholderia phenoliruptrix]WMY11794.1 haloacid dehalogenase type II [Paraburkholderia phenoliruptrix]